jgi:hypothetical protein
MPKVATPHSWLTVIAVIFVVCMAGCPAANLFKGRFLIINSTGKDLTGISLKVGGTTCNFAKTSADQGWIRNLGSVAIHEEIEISWQTSDGNQYQHSIPFRRIVPDQCNDDLIVELTGPGTVETRLARVAE